MVKCGVRRNTASDASSASDVRVLWSCLPYAVSGARNDRSFECSGPAGMRACSLGLIGFRVRDKVRVSVRVSTFYFLSC